MKPNAPIPHESIREHFPDTESAEYIINETHGAKRDGDEIVRLDQEISEANFQHLPEFDFKADTAWSKAGPCHDTATIDFELDMRDFLATDSPQVELETQGDALREKIFRYVFEEGVQRIVKDSCHGKILCYQNLKTKSEIKHESSTQHQQGENGFSACLNIKLDIDMKSNQDVHPIAALYNCGGQIASAVADTMMHNLEDWYLGNEESDVHSEAEYENGKIVKFKTKAGDE